MIRPPSLQNQRDDYWSGDPAFVQLPPNATDEQREEHARKWRIARETGNYGDLLIQDAKPTKFVFQPMPGDVYRRLVDRVQAGRMGMLELHALAFRVAVVDVANLGDVKVRPMETELGTMATAEITNVLDACAPGCVNELGAEVIQRAIGLSGK